MTMLTGRRLIGSMDMDNLKNLTALFRYGIAAIMLNKSLYAGEIPETQIYSKKKS
jgi:hypothetical protein